MERAIRVITGPADGVGRANGMLDREHEAPPGSQGAEDLPDDGRVIGHVVQGHGRDDDVIDAGLRRVVLDGAVQVGNRRILRQSGRFLQHPPRQVERRDARGPRLPCIPSEVAETAAQVEDAGSRKVRQQSSQGRDLERAVEARVVQPKRLVTREEAWLVIDVLWFLAVG
jgi:hypothetical protein